MFSLKIYKINEILTSESCQVTPKREDVLFNPPCSSDNFVEIEVKYLKLQ